MSWTEKKISLPFMGAESRNRAQEETGGRDSGVSKEEPVNIRQAALRKFTRNGIRKKWFVLLGPTSTEPARLQYWDNERKWRAKTPAKRSIVLNKCFNINRKLDTRDARNKIVIALYTLADCVCIVFETENELSDWLDQLLTLQQGSRGNLDGRKPVPNYEYMWNVTVKTFTPEENNFTQVDHLKGPQRLCVTSNSVKFFPVGSEHCVEFPHACLRCCAVNDRHFKLETGRNSPSGSGALLIDCSDSEVSQYLHKTMIKAMANSSSKELYLKNGRSRTHSLSELQKISGGSSSTSFQHSHALKSIPRSVERNRTISEPPWEGSGKPGQVTPEPGMKPPRPHSVRYIPFSTSPNTNNPLSPTSPVGSVGAGLSSDGTGSSNSINDPLGNGGDHEPHISNMNSGYQPDVIPEESSGEMTFEFNQKPTSSTPPVVHQTLPRSQAQRAHHHTKQASLTGLITYDDYMDMGGPTPPPPPPPPKPPVHPGPTLLRRNMDPSSSSSIFSSSLPVKSAPLTNSPAAESAPSGSSYSSEYHTMSSSTSTTAPSPATPTEGIYFDMGLGETSCSPTSSSTPLKSTSSVTLVPRQEETSSTLPARTPPVAIKTPTGGGLPPSTILTPPEGGVGGEGGAKLQRPTADGGYVIMSPGVGPNITEEPPHSLAMLEESLGSWRGSPRHASPRRDRSSRPDSKRNSYCMDDSEAHWDTWRYETDVPDSSTDDIYAHIYYPGRTSSSASHPRPTPNQLSRVSPASSSSAVSGTPSSDSRFTDFHDRLEKVSSFLREEDEDEERVSKRPPHGRKNVHTPKYMEIPSSKSSSRSNVSPFGRTPPTGASNRPTVASTIAGLFRHRAGSVPTRPPIFERKRHRTQSEGEKDVSQDGS